jgi:hypothetical protein
MKKNVGERHVEQARDRSVRNVAHRSRAALPSASMSQTTSLGKVAPRFRPTHRRELLDGTAETFSDDAIEQVVRQLNGICRTATLGFALSVGGLIVATIYGGDIARLRTRNPKKDQSLRKLARHPNLAMSPDALYRSIAIFEVCERLGIQSWKHVSTTHLRLVLPLPPEEQARLLAATEANKWPAQRLDEEVRTLVRRHPSMCANRGGRRRVSLLKSRMRSFQKLATALEDILGPECGIDEPSPDSARTAIDVLQAIAQKCAVLENRLARHLVGSETTPPPRPLGADEGK